MGCDIHLYSESRKDGKWVADRADTFEIDKENADDDGVGWASMNGSYHLGRHYGLFGLLAKGVRYDTKHAWPQRGLPDDVSSQVKQISDQWDGDGHCHSWLTVDELKRKRAELLLQTGHVDIPYFDSMLAQLVEGLPITGADPKDQRIVFFFDN